MQNLQSVSNEASMKCQNCGLVNFATDKECKRCGSPLVRARESSPLQRANWICQDCGSLTNKASSAKAGSVVAEIILFVASIVVFWLYSWIVGLLIFGALAIYGGWRATAMKKRICPACGSSGVIPIGTPAGQELATRFHKNA